MNPPDANWLYSSMTQVSAAIVAIVAGFMTTFGLASGGEYRRTRRRTYTLRHDVNKGKEALKATDLTIEERQSLEQQVEELEFEFNELLEDGLELLYQFKLVRRGFLALGALLVTGVILPLVLLPQTQGTYQPWQGRTVIAAFLIGLVPVIAFIWAVVDTGSYVPPRGWATHGQSRRVRRWMRGKGPSPASPLSERRNLHNTQKESPSPSPSER
jgi:hypothetical protein